MTQIDWQRLLRWLYAVGFALFVAGYLLLETAFFIPIVGLMMALALVTMVASWKAN